MENTVSKKKFYSKQELVEFKEIINRKLEEARIEYRRLSESLKSSGGNTADSYNFTEYGNESREKEQVEILMARQRKFIRNLEFALIRIENGTYGICKKSGELIPKARLRVVPHTTTTIEAKQSQNRR